MLVERRGIPGPHDDGDVVLGHAERVGDLRSLADGARDAPGRDDHRTARRARGIAIAIARSAEIGAPELTGKVDGEVSAEADDPNRRAGDGWARSERRAARVLEWIGWGEEQRILRNEDNAVVRGARRRRADHEPLPAECRARHCQALAEYALDGSVLIGAFPHGQVAPRAAPRDVGLTLISGGVRIHLEFLAIQGAALIDALAEHTESIVPRRAVPHDDEIPVGLDGDLR